MKNKNKPRYSIMAITAVVLTVAIWSCNKSEDPSLQDLRNDKLSYLQDSIRIADSLKRINAAGVINYTINVVSGSTSTLFKNGNGSGRSKENLAAIEGATVTIGQFGKTETATTDASGMVVFKGYFRAAVTVRIVKEGFTSVSYTSVVKDKDMTENGGIFFVGNIIPLFELTGANTATISGKATIQTNLTNKTRELVPDGTTIRASINAMNTYFGRRFLTENLYFEVYDYESESSYYDYYAGHIIDASYDTGVLGTVTGGNYTITVPAAIDGLPLQLDYSEIAADQTFFEKSSTSVGNVNTARALFGRDVTPDDVPDAGGVDITFVSGQNAEADPVIAIPGTIARINVTNGGVGYLGTPVLNITSGGGSGATATAIVTNGVITGVNLTNAGSGFSSTPSVSLLAGGSATATVTSLQSNGTVTGVSMTNLGFGYTSAPSVTFSAPPTAGGVTATGTATIDGSGRVTGVTITNPGSGYTTAAITVTFGAAPAGGTTATGTGIYSGQSIGPVTITSGGAGYSFPPVVTFAAPTLGSGVRATGTAVIDPTSGQVVNIIVTNPGSGYTTAPAVTFTTGSGATFEVQLTGGPVISVSVTDQGQNYSTPPIINIKGDGLGATATAVVSGGKLVGINVTNGGSGYTPTATEVEIISGSGAKAVAVLDSNGSITGFTMVSGGSNYLSAPAIEISGVSGIGGGATATSTVSGGRVTGLNVVNGGSGYIDGNWPASAEYFGATKGSYMETKPGLKYANDIHWGTGQKQR